MTHVQCVSIFSLIFGQKIDVSVENKQLICPNKLLGQPLKKEPKSFISNISMSQAPAGTTWDKRALSVVLSYNRCETSFQNNSKAGKKSAS